MSQPPMPTVASLKEGEKITGTFLCKRKAASSDRNGRPFLSLVLADCTGEVEALLWDRVDEQGQGFEGDDPVTVSGKVAQFQGRRQLHLRKIRLAGEDERPMEELVPASTLDIDQVVEEISALLSGLEHPHLRALGAAYLDDAPYMEALARAPAARSFHHAHRGGLLEHTLSVMRLTDAICAHYREAQPGLLNRDLCIMGAWLHDLGKVDEISPDGGFNYTSQGRLLGHLLLGMRVLDGKIAGLPDFPAELADHVRHLVASHHGRLEHGSPKLPMTAEALVLHRADEMDSTLANLNDLLKQTGQSDWTAYQAHLERYFYKGGESGEGE